MGVKVRGVQQVSKNMHRILNDIEGKRVVRASYAALNVIALESASMVPIDTSTLINSQFREVIVGKTRVTGRVGYSANYAAYVHEAPGKYLGTKTFRPVGKGESPGSKGYIWDKTGEPKFLEKAGDKTQGQAQDAIRRELSL